ncbi:MAG: zinc-ribbon domain-containing protein [Deltaproteobacteria bacterium]|nr:zinc-ribbon domain-containing protein [Deltaproteobacteria bacterium]
MFFVIAGIQPKTVILDDQPRMCTSCGLYQARMQRTDQYFSFFFFPVFPVKKGVPFLQCRSCGAVSNEFGEPLNINRNEAFFKCPNCRKALNRSYRFCPFCGSPLREG